MVNNYPEYAAGVNYKKTDSNGNRHFYSAQVVADPANETVESKLIKDGVVIDEGGGGGTSDFTTAEVTITNSTNSSISQSCIAILELMGAQMMTSEIPPLDVDASVTVNMVLFKGSQIIYAPENVTIAVTGDITDDSGELTITGAGTITYTAK